MSSADNIALQSEVYQKNMNKNLFLLGLALMANDVLGGAAIKVKFGWNILEIGETFFITLPHHLNLTKEYGWIKYDRPNTTHLESLDMYCPNNDVTVCILFDDCGYPGGVQIALRNDLISEAMFDWTDQGYTNWKTEVNGTTQELWATTQYFMSNNYLKRSKEERQKNYNTDNLLQEQRVWFTGFDKKIFEIPDNVTGVVDAGFTEQSCIFWMGRHYVFNMTADTVCSSKTIFPYFMLVRSGKIVGSGLNIMAKYNTTGTPRVWNENADESAVRAIVSDGPECMYNYGKSPGVITFHIYFTDDPYLNICIFQ